MDNNNPALYVPDDYVFYCTVYSTPTLVANARESIQDVRDWFISPKHHKVPVSYYSCQDNENT